MDGGLGGAPRAAHEAHVAGGGRRTGHARPRQVFAAAAFARPSLDVMLWTGSADDDIAYEMIPSVLKSLQPVAERAGLAAAIDPDLATLAERLRATAREEGTLIGPLVVGAAARRAL